MTIVNRNFHFPLSGTTRMALTLMDSKELTVRSRLKQKRKLAK